MVTKVSDWFICSPIKVPTRCIIDDSFEGLRQALDRYLQSAWAGYANFGSDIGGYRGTPNADRSYDLLLRWAQLGAFSPLMENGGEGEHRPWMVDLELADFVTNVYR